MSMIKLENIDALFFDMDNTVIKTREGDFQTCLKLNYLLNEKFDVEFPIAEKLTSLFLRKFRENAQKIDEPLDDWRLSLWKETLGSCYEHLADDIYKEWLLLRYQYIKLTADVKSLLCELKSLYNLGLISNGNSDRQWEKIRACDLELYFDCIVVAGDTPWKKPDVNIFFKACDKLKVKPEQCLMIGDRVETDIQGAKNANFATTIWINYNTSYQTLPNENNYPDFIVDDVLQVRDVLSQLHAQNLVS